MLLILRLVGGIGPSSTTLGDHVGTLGAEHFCRGHFVVVVVAKLLIVCHFSHHIFGTLT